MRIYIILFLVVLAKCQYSSLQVSFDHAKTFLNQRLNKLVYGQRIICQSQDIHQQSIKLSNQSIELYFPQGEITLYEMNSKLFVEIPNTQTESRYQYKSLGQVFNGQYLTNSKITLNVNFSNDQNDYLQISLSKKEISISNSDVSLPEDYQKYKEIIKKRLDDQIEDCLISNLQQISQSINNILNQIQDQNISTIKGILMYEKCKLIDVLQKQLNFQCKYFIHSSKNNQRIEAPQFQAENFPKKEIETGYIYQYHENIYKYIFHSMFKIGRLSKNLPCQQAKYVTLVYGIESYLPGIKQFTSAAEAVRCQVNTVTPPLFEADGNRYIIKAQNITASLGSATFKDETITHTFANLKLSLEFNFLMEINEEHIMRLRVNKFEISNLKYLKEENGAQKEVAFTQIEQNLNYMQSMFYDGLSKKGLFGNGLNITSNYFNINKPNVYIQNGYNVLEVNPVF